MNVAYADEWADEARAQGGDYPNVRQMIEDRATADTPIYLGVIIKVTYVSAKDHYVGHTGTGVTIRVSNAVAQFLLQHANMNSNYGAKPTVYAKMEDGIITDVTLLFLSRE